MKINFLKKFNQNQKMPKKNLMFAGFLLSMILVLGIVPFVNAVGITGYVPSCGGYAVGTILSGSKCCKDGLWYSASSANLNCRTSSEIDAADGTTDARTTTSTDTRASLGRGSKYAGWEPVEAADGGKCWVKPQSNRGLGLFGGR